MIRRIIKYLLALVGLEIKKNSFPRFNELNVYGIPYEEWESRQKKYYLKLFKIQVPKESPLILRYAVAKQIQMRAGGLFFYDENDRLRLSIQGVTFFINYPDELFVINEVFVLRDYNFRTTDQIVVIDIGLNIGVTALFFARQDNVKRVYAYELFQPTFLAAQENLLINDSSKIVAINVGLGKESSQLQLPYSQSSKAMMGLNRLPDAEMFPDAIMVSVDVADAADEIVRINELEPGLKKVCKMDCEGAEFEILERLFQRNVARFIDVYIIEWHARDTEPIETQFLANGFDIIKSMSDIPQLGLLYAFKK